MMGPSGTVFTLLSLSFSRLSLSKFHSNRSESLCYSSWWRRWTHPTSIQAPTPRWGVYQGGFEVELRWTERGLRVGSRLGRGWIEDRGWIDVGSRLDRGSIEVGSKLDRGWIDIGSRLDRAGSRWVEVGSRLDRCWVNVG
jgi:hypothetical protein